MVAEVIPTRVQLTFSQLQNFIADVAIERNYEYYFWGHADVALLASSASSSFSEEIFGCAVKLKHLTPCPNTWPNPDSRTHDHEQKRAAYAKLLTQAGVVKSVLCFCIMVSAQA